MSRLTFKSSIKGFFNILAVLLMSPLAFCSYLEKTLTCREEIFVFLAQAVSILPGLPGVYLRRAYYRMTLDRCSLDSFIGFGTAFTHRNSSVEDKVYIGSWALIGCATLRCGCLIGSRASILSGSFLHEQDINGRWLPYSVDKLRIVDIGNHSWIGEGAIIMADIGERALVSAGAVVSAAVPPKTVVAGNPARYVRNLEKKLT
jgi:virginiamycin A acetyltransferase